MLGSKIDMDNIVRVIKKIYPKITSNKNNGAIISWIDYEKWGSTDEIYAQQIDSSGINIWPSDGCQLSKNPGHMLRCPGLMCRCLQRKASYSK